jgi:hypothetical protein
LARRVKLCGTATDSPRYERFLAENFARVLTPKAKYRLVVRRGRPIVLS